MALSEAITNKLKVLIYENKDFEAIKVLKKETDLSYDEATEYVHRLKESLGKGSVKPVKDNSMLLLIIFASVSGLFWVLAIYFYISKSDQIEQSVLIEGRVTAMVRSEDGSAPVVTYMFNNIEYQYQSSIYANPPSHAVGDVVELFVVENNPEEAMINSFVDRWLLIMIFGILALVFDIAAVAALKMKPKSVSSSVDFLEKDDGFSRNFD
jgi:hypothetical protein